MITVTEEILDGVELRTAYLLAGLEVPEYGVIRQTNFEGTTTIKREAPELPSGRALLAQLLGEGGRRMNERSVIIAKEAALLEMVLAQPKGEGNN